MNRLFDTSLDVNLRQFYILVICGCLGNFSGFLGNAVIYGFGPGTIFCGICALLIILSSFYGIHFGHTKRASYFVILLLTFIEFPLLYYIYHTNTIVYMILSIAGIAIFIPAAHAVILAVLAVFCDVFVVVFSHYHPAPWAVITEQEAFYSTLCSLVISLFCVFMITLLLKVQYEKQTDDLSNMGEQLKNAADHDALTALYNRRYLNRYLEQLIQKDHTDFYAVLLDLDFFKKINDTYGHVFGDEVLVAFGQILEKHLPDGGIAVRFGGEEFMLILPDTTEGDIRSLLQCMRSEYKQFIKKEKNTVYSFSSGVAQYQTGMEISALYSLVDGKLYRAKNDNRDKDVF